ncbi:MAG: ectoine/hydroxyectoine ABC transporter permease subunit EhuD [Rhodospirillales bacterium]|nr:ectoine/hydroxyectoine ABC transporter permease subunit EhuD [Rhodospirillales bacterium]
MEWDWNYVIAFMPRLLQGLVITVEATFLATVLALVTGLLIAVAKRSRNEILRIPVHWSNEFVRRTPLLVQIYFVFFVLPDAGITLSPLAAGVIALGLHSSSYMSEVYRAGIDGLPRGQWEAAKALNYRPLAMWVRVILPQAVPPMIPPLGNYLIIMFKETALLSTISVVELMGAARIVGNESYRYFEPISMVGLTFLVICLPAAFFVRYLEMRLARR